MSGPEVLWNAMLGCIAAVVVALMVFGAVWFYDTVRAMHLRRRRRKGGKYKLPCHAWLAAVAVMVRPDGSVPLWEWDVLGGLVLGAVILLGGSALVVLVLKGLIWAGKRLGAMVLQAVWVWRERRRVGREHAGSPAGDAGSREPGRRFGDAEFHAAMRRAAVRVARQEERLQNFRAACALGRVHSTEEDGGLKMEDRREPDALDRLDVELADDDGALGDRALPQDGGERALPTDWVGARTEWEDPASLCAGTHPEGAPCLLCRPTSKVMKLAPMERFPQLQRVQADADPFGGVPDASDGSEPPISLDDQQRILTQCVMAARDVFGKLDAAHGSLSEEDSDDCIVEAKRQTALLERALKDLKRRTALVASKCPDCRKGKSPVWLEKDEWGHGYPRQGLWAHVIASDPRAKIYFNCAAMKGRDQQGRAIIPTKEAPAP